jgi:hypothetical protein
MEISLFQFFLFSCSSHSYNFLVFHKLKEKKGEKKEKKKKKKKKKGKKGEKPPPLTPQRSPKIHLKLTPKNTYVYHSHSNVVPQNSICFHFCNPIFIPKTKVAVRFSAK